MDTVIIHSLIALVVAIPLSLIGMRILFKNSIFCKITFWWVMSLLTEIVPKMSNGTWKAELP